jgi:predicted Zn-dependent protease
VNLARIEAMKGSLPAAIDVLQTALKVMPGDTGLMVVLAEAQIADGRTEAAITTLDAIVRQDPSNDIAANNLAALLSANTTDPAQLARAEKLAQRFRTSDNPSFLDTLGRIYFLQGRTAEALPLLAKAVKLAPGSPVLRYHFGMALMKSGDVAAAKVQLREAVASKVEFRGIDEARKALQDG